MSLQFTESDCRIFSSSFNYLLSVPFCKEFSNQLSSLTKAQITPDLCFYHLSTHKIEKDLDVCPSLLFTLWVKLLKDECCEAGESSGQLNLRSFDAHLCMPVTRQSCLMWMGQSHLTVYAELQFHGTIYMTMVISLHIIYQCYCTNVLKNSPWYSI